ncbi:unnamed protein product [Closterium sp. Naga37s-1]|nr:unnamed protein product [Closterium sp. Naga37s-1]
MGSDGDGDGEAGMRMQLVSGTGEFDREGLERFARATRMTECGLSYAVIAIVGPQSSGKSTLLNHLFHTTFDEMDALKGRRQTTQGIWVAEARGIRPFTLVLDIEGTDSRERGEDDTTFEKQSSLFALAVADVIIVNMWCHDIGREQASNKPLLKTVFQVMMRLFTPRKATLLFVIRDKTKTPMDTLEPILREDIQKIWQSVPKPQKHQDTPFADFFNVEVTALPNFEEREEEFKSQVARLRDRFQDSVAEGRLAGDRRGVVPASGFPLSVAEMWRVIRENKDLDLPAHKVMVATVRCEQIAAEKLAQLQDSEEWVALQAAGEAGREAEHFGGRANELAASALATYDAEAAYFEEGVRDSKRQLLLKGMSALIRPVHTAVVAAAAARCFHSFKTDLDEATGGRDGSAASFADSSAACLQAAALSFESDVEDADVALFSWSVEEVRAKLTADMESHVASLRSQKLKQIVTDAEASLSEAISEPIAALLETVTDNTWRDIRAVFFHQLDAACSDVEQAVGGFQLGEDEQARLKGAVEAAGRKVVEERVRRESQHALSLMKDRWKGEGEGGSEGENLDVSENATIVGWMILATSPSLLFPPSSNPTPFPFLLPPSLFSLPPIPLLSAHSPPLRPFPSSPPIPHFPLHPSPPHQALRLLAVVAAMRLDTVDNSIETTLLSLLGEGATGEGGDSSRTQDGESGEGDGEVEGEGEGEGEGKGGSRRVQRVFTSAGLLAASKWEKVSRWMGRGGEGAAVGGLEVAPDCTFLTPGQCRALWGKLKAETQYVVAQAMQTQEASRRNNAWLPPPWAILAMVVLGWNEFMAVLRNPVLLLLGVFVFFMGREVMAQLDLGGIFDNGMVPGLITLAARAGPIIISVLKRLGEQAEAAFTANNGPVPGPLRPNWHSEGDEDGGDVAMQDFSAGSSGEGGLRQRGSRREGEGREGGDDGDVWRCGDEGFQCGEQWAEGLRQ